MRIAYMLTSLGIGGAEKQVIAIGERLAARGHDIALIVLKSPEVQECATELPIHRLGVTKSLFAVVGCVQRAHCVVRAFKPHLLHSHTFPGNMMARAVRATGAAPVVVSTIHNVYEGTFHRTLAYRITDPFTAGSTAVSQAVRDEYVRSRAVPSEKISVLTNGIDTDVFSPHRFTAGEAEPTRPHCSDGGFKWLAAGRDVPAKDFDSLLAAFRIVRVAKPNVQLCIAGQPASHRVDEPGVKWLGLSNDMPATFAACDAFVLSSAWEGLPLVVGEAMAMEKPVVATNVGGVCEFVNNTGALVSPKAPRELAEAMLQIMRLSELKRREMGRRARELILRDFDINAKADEWEALYWRVLNDR